MTLRNTNGFQYAGKTLLFYSGNDSIISVPEGVAKIADNAFANNNLIEQVTLPSTLECIEEKAFLKCKKLRNINLPQGLKKIESAAFKECGIETISIPSSVEVIEKGAFQDCRNLRVIDIAVPQTQLVLEAYVFQCTAIEEITFPVGVVEIGNYAISSCEQLKRIRILDKSAKLGDALIYLDRLLEDIEMPNGIKSLKQKTLATDVWLGGGGACCATKILAPLSTFKTLLKWPFEEFHIVCIAAATYMENVKLFSAKDQKAWDAYITENAMKIREKMGDGLSVAMGQYLESRGL